jgi:hypothetical protein
MPRDHPAKSVHLGELWWLEDLALSCRRDGRHEMFLTAAPINVPGGIGSPANALAIKLRRAVKVSEYGPGRHTARCPGS